ncbi:MAG: hypothetical protein WAN22_32680, partial [Solirubrobacteraceae bacterium]
VRSSTLTPTVASAGKAHFNTGTYEQKRDPDLEGVPKPTRSDYPAAVGPGRERQSHDGRSMTAGDARWSAALI